MQTVGTSCYMAELQVHELHQHKNYMLATYFRVKYTVEIHHMNYWYLTRGTTWSLRTAISHHGHQAHISVALHALKAYTVHTYLCLATAQTDTRYHVQSTPELYIRPPKTTQLTKTFRCCSIQL